MCFPLEEQANSEEGSDSQQKITRDQQISEDKRTKIRAEELVIRHAWNLNKTELEIEQL